MMLYQGRVLCSGRIYGLLSAVASQFDNQLTNSFAMSQFPTNRGPSKEPDRRPDGSEHIAERPLNLPPDREGPTSSRPSSDLPATESFELASQSIVNQKRLLRAIVGALPTAFAHGFIWLLLFLVLLIYVPKFKNIFKGFGKPLPPVTEALISVSDLLVAFFPVTAFFFLVVMAADFAFLSFLRWKSSAEKDELLWASLASLWSILFLCVTLLMLGWSIVGIFLPMIQLIEGLSPKT